MLSGVPPRGLPLCNSLLMGLSMPCLLLHAWPTLMKRLGACSSVADASGDKVGAALLQHGRPVAFESKKLDETQKRWHPGEYKLFAVIHALAKWRCYLEGPTFKILSDHEPLQWLKSQPNLSRRQARWMEWLTRFKYDWEYIPGRQNMADPLSRLPDACADPMMLAAVTTRAHGSRAVPDAVGGEDVPLHTTQPDFERHPPAAPPVLASPAGATAFSVTMTFCNRLSQKNKQLVIPDAGSLRHDVVTFLHSSPFTAHAGTDKTTELVMRTYWWPGLRESVKHVVAHCDTCQRYKSSSLPTAGEFYPLPIPDDKFEDLIMDFMTGLPETKTLAADPRGYDAIMVVVDRLAD
eukprot:366571-Chlamydomonas_euryale.AAC.7